MGQWSRTSGSWNLARRARHSRSVCFNRHWQRGISSPFTWGIAWGCTGHWTPSSRRRRSSWPRRRVWLSATCGSGRNSNLFLQQLGQDYLPAISDLHQRLTADPPARIADIGRGLDWACVGVAQAYPNARVDGFDLDPASVAEAQTIPRENGVADRVF